MTATTCAFTGHRPKSFPWKYNEAAPDCVLLKELLAKQIKLLANRGGRIGCRVWPKRWTSGVLKLFST